MGCNTLGYYGDGGLDRYGCNHEDCGILCDEHILAERLALRQAGGRGRSLTVEHIRAEGLLPIRQARAEQLLRAGHHTRRAIAQQTGLSHQAVGRLAEGIGAPLVTVVHVDQDQTDRIEELHAEGWSVRRIAAEVGCSKSAVSRRLSQGRQGRHGHSVPC